MIKRLMLFLLLVAVFAVAMYLARNVGNKVTAPEPSAAVDEQPGAVADTVRAFADTTIVQPDTLDSLD